MPVYKYRWWVVYILTNPLHDHDIIKEYDYLKEPSNPHEAELLWRVRHSHGNHKECQILKIARSYQHVGEMGSGCMAWFDTSQQLKDHICIIDRSKISKLPLIPIDPCEKCGNEWCIWNNPKNPQAYYLCTNGFHHACETCKICKKTCKYPNIPKCPSN